jgi:putative membrane protein
MRLAIATSILLATALGAPLNAQTQTRERPAGATSTTPQAQRVTTQEFLNKVWNVNNFEIQAGREAENKAKDTAFRDYAQMIVADHTKMSDDLNNVVNKMRGAQLPKSLDKAHEQKLQQLTSASAQAFEEKFRTQQIDGHQQAIKLFQDYATTGDNDELKRWAQTSVAMLERHLERAQALRKPSGVM